MGWFRAVMFEDPEFRADDSSLGSDLIESLNGRKVVWLRAVESWHHPDSRCWPPKERFAALPDDVVQGQLADCFLASALSLLTTFPGLVDALVDRSQAVDGKYSVCVWERGQRRLVVVDDRIPCCAESRRPLFAHCKDLGECWVQIVEKAMAKRKGSYSCLMGGHMGECLHDLTGSPAPPHASPATSLQPRLHTSSWCRAAPPSAPSMRTPSILNNKPPNL